MGEKGETYNINADTAAGAIAGALGAKRFLLLTDVDEDAAVLVSEKLRIIVANDRGDHGATPMITDTPHPLWQHSNAERIKPTCPTHSNE